MTNPLTYDETMALAGLIGMRIVQPAEKIADFIYWQETYMGKTTGRLFDPFDPRWCGAYIQWLSRKKFWVLVHMNHDCRFFICRDWSYAYARSEGATPTEAVARCVLAVMRERGDVK